jgi:hypothetical protein
MAIPIWTVGEVLASSDVNSWFVPVEAVRTSTQSVTSSTVLVNDTQLLVPVAANASYHFLTYLFYEGGTQGSSDIKVGYAVPAGTTMRYHRIYANTSGLAVNISTLTETDVQGAGTQGAGIACGLTHHGTIVTSATTGNVQLQWAQSTSSATATQVLAQSAILLTRIG